MSPKDPANNPRRISILETIRNRDSNGSNNNENKPTGNSKGLTRPVVARISLWTPRTSSKLTRNGGGRHESDSGNDDDDDDDSDDGDSYHEGGESCDEHDLELDDNSQLEQRLKQANLPDYVWKVATKEMQKLRRTPSFMSDYAVTRSYLELIAELPWNESTAEQIDLRKSRRDLDNDHYGMQKLKERVLQYLAVRKLKQVTNNQFNLDNNNHRSHTRMPPGTGPTPLTQTNVAATAAAAARFRQPILLFVGPPGTGKTSIAQSIANSLGRKFQRISLGGVADQSAIRGHRRTYIGAMPGRIIQGIKQVGVNNPVFLLDEVDKMDSGPQGDPSSALLEVLDPEQNHTFTDHYLNVAFDLSRVLFIATANSLDTIPAALLDRMEVIQVAGYTHEEKFNIARRHLVPKQVIENGLKMNMIVFKDEAIHKIITSYAREAGVRALERRIATICRVVAVKIVEHQPAPTVSDNAAAAAAAGAATAPNQQQRNADQQQLLLRLPFVVDADSLESFLGPAVYDKETNSRANVPGVAIGLAWTATGGEITFVEAEIMKGSKKDSLVLTGQLGSVMRESAMLALNWIRANHHNYEALPQTLDRELVENTVHIHFPAGAVGKDGPSAGVTIVVALISLCSNISVVPDLAMTGEITLRGVVLRVGGVKSKVLAAHRAGIKRVILPAKNEPDLNEIPSSIRDKMKFHFASTIEEVLRIAFDNKLQAKNNATRSAGDQQQQQPAPSRLKLMSKL